jgi:hypothetical protein
MAAPVADKVQLPDDSGNAGKKIRTQTRVVGANTVHEHFYINQHPHEVTGMYYYHSGALTVPIAAHNGTTTGHFWLINPSGATIRGALRSISALAAILAVAADLLYTRQVCSLVTFTGTPSGATIAPAKRDSTDAAAQMSLRTASTGLTVTLGNPFRHFVPPLQAGTTGVGVFPTMVFPERQTDIDECIVFRTGEGMVFWSADASTTTNKRISVDLETEERDAT